jgi:DNA-binding MarR family transcriptional regulator
MYNETGVETPAGAAKPIGDVETGMLGLLGAAQTLQSRLESALESVGLSIPKYLTLQRLLGAGEPVSLSALAEQQRCGRSNITQLIDRLEVDGLVERVSDPADRRGVRASVTTQGNERFKAGTEAINEVQTQLASRVAPEDRESFLRVLEAIRQP